MYIYIYIDIDVDLDIDIDIDIDTDVNIDIDTDVNIDIDIDGCLYIYIDGCLYIYRYRGHTYNHWWTTMVKMSGFAVYCVYLDITVLWFYTCLDTYVYIGVYIYTYIYIYIYLYTYIYICVCVSVIFSSMYKWEIDCGCWTNPTSTMFNWSRKRHVCGRLCTVVYHSHPSP